MTPRERVMTALDRRQADRVPYLELIIDPGVIAKVNPEWDYETCVREFEIDAIGTNEPWDPSSVEWVDEETKTFRDAWGVIRRHTTEVGSFPLEGPIKSESDLRAYTPPDPTQDGLLPLIKDVIVRNQGQRAVFFPGRDGWIHASYLLDMEELLVDLILKPQLVHDVMDMVVDYHLRVMREAIRAGVDFVVFADDYAFNTAPLMSPAHFREFVYPRLKRVVKEAHDLGAKAVKHTDGNINLLLDMIVETGIDGLHPLEPTANMDIGRVKAEYGDRICVMGNVDCAQLLTFGTPDEVRAAVRECVRAASPGGGHILSSSNSIHSSVKPENFVALVEAAHEYGEYPIRL